MPNINYEIPDKLHRALKSQAAEEGITLKALVIRLLTAGLRNTSPALLVEGKAFLAALKDPTEER